jgi:gamma-glutamylcyclotransferase (GGCT)/AIG2-like uncharacterized protein YtfP
MQFDFLFVYGTLLSNYLANDFQQKIARNAQLIGNGYCLGKLFKIDFYPGFVENHQNEVNKVYGEIYKMPFNSSLIADLDEYEDYLPHNLAASLYIRKKIKVNIISSPVKLDCWIYVYNQDITACIEITGGDFIAFLKNEIL